MLEPNVAAVGPSLSLKDAQRCFDKERRAFLRDLETLRQQLVRKEQLANKAAATASAHAVQLKREIATLQAAVSAAETSRDDFRARFAHSSSLLESALDQHQEDQSRLAELTETLRTLEKRHEEALALVKKEAATSVSATHEERKALRARVDQLRCKLEKERKDWQGEKRPLSDELAKARTRLSILDKELQEARFRESSSFQLRDKMAAEVGAYKRKLEDTAEALQAALSAKSALRSEHLLMVKRSKQKVRELLEAHQHSKNQLLMLQEDYNGLFRTRSCVEQQNARMYESMKQMKARHEETVKAMERERWELEKQHKKASVTCSSCLKTPEARVEDEARKLEAAREQTRLQVAKDMELERWDRFQEVNTKYITTCETLQSLRQQSDEMKVQFQRLEREWNELVEKNEALEEELNQSSEREDASVKEAQEAARQLEESKKTVQTLMDNLNNLTAVTADQSKKVQELEASRDQEHEHLEKSKIELESELGELRASHETLTKELEQFREQYELLKREKARHWNEIVEAQLSANLLIEEQAHTIDDLLKTKLSEAYVSPGKGKLLSPLPSPLPSLLPSSVPSTPIRESEASLMYTSTPQRASPARGLARLDCSDGDSSTSSDSKGTVEVLRGERNALASALRALETQFRAEKKAWRGEYEHRSAELLREVTKLQSERAKLKRRVDEQAVTIHELTLQEDDEDEEEEGDQSGSESEYDNSVVRDGGVAGPVGGYPPPPSRRRSQRGRDDLVGRHDQRRRETTPTAKQHSAGWSTPSPGRAVSWRSPKEASISRGELSFRSSGS